jgi:hypothetical protein
MYRTPHCKSIKHWTTSAMKESHILRALFMGEKLKGRKVGSGGRYRNRIADDDVRLIIRVAK